MAKEHHFKIQNRCRQLFGLIDYLYKTQTKKSIEQMLSR